MLLSLGKNIFFSPPFFSTLIILMPFNFQSWRFVFKERLYTQNYHSFFRWGYGELILRYCCLKCKFLQPGMVGLRQKYNPFLFRRTKKVLKLYPDQFFKNK